MKPFTLPSLAITLLASLTVLGGCAQSPANPAVSGAGAPAGPRSAPGMPNIPAGASVLQQFPWSGGVANVLRMPNGTSRILFSPVAGVDLGPAGEPYIERVDPVADGALFLVRAAAPGCRHGYRLFRVNGTKVAGWVLQACQRDLGEDGGQDGELKVVTIGGSSWEAIQRDRHEGKVRVKVIDWHAADPDHLSYHERIEQAATSSAKPHKTTASAAVSASAPAASAAIAAGHVTHASQTSQMGSQVGSGSAPLPAKVSVGAEAPAAPLEVNLDGASGH